MPIRWSDFTGGLRDVFFPSERRQLVEKQRQAAFIFQGIQLGMAARQAREATQAGQPQPPPLPGATPQERQRIRAYGAGVPAREIRPTLPTYEESFVQKLDEGGWNYLRQVVPEIPAQLGRVVAGRARTVGEARKRIGEALTQGLPQFGREVAAPIKRFFTQPVTPEQSAATQRAIVLAYPEVFKPETVEQARQEQQQHPYIPKQGSPEETQLLGDTILGSILAATPLQNRIGQLQHSIETKQPIFQNLKQYEQAQRDIVQRVTQEINRRAVTEGAASAAYNTLIAAGPDALLMLPYEKILGSGIPLPREARKLWYVMALGAQTGKYPQDSTVKNLFNTIEKDVIPPERGPSVGETLISGVGAIFGGPMIWGPLKAAFEGAPTGEVLKTLGRGAARFGPAAVIGLPYALLSGDKKWASYVGAGDAVNAIRQFYGYEKLSNLIHTVLNLAGDPVMYTGMVSDPLAIVGTRGEVAASRLARTLVSEGAATAENAADIARLGRITAVQSQMRLLRTWASTGEARTLAKAMPLEQFVADGEGALKLAEFTEPRLVGRLAEAGVSRDTMLRVSQQSAEIASRTPLGAIAAFNPVPKWLPIPGRDRFTFFVGRFRPSSMKDWAEWMEKSEAAIRIPQGSPWWQGLWRQARQTFSAFGNLPPEAWEAPRLSRSLFESMMQESQQTANKIREALPSAKERDLLTWIQSGHAHFPTDPASRDAFVSAVRNGDNPWRMALAAAKDEQGNPIAEAYASAFPQEVADFAKTLPEDRWQAVHDTMDHLNQTSDFWGQQDLKRGFIDATLAQMRAGEFDATTLPTGRPGAKAYTEEQIDAAKTALQRAIDKLSPSANREIAARQAIVDGYQQSGGPVMFADNMNKEVIRRDILARRVSALENRLVERAKYDEKLANLLKAREARGKSVDQVTVDAIVQEANKIPGARLTQDQRIWLQDMEASVKEDFIWPPESPEAEAFADLPIDTAQEVAKVDGMRTAVHDLSRDAKFWRQLQTNLEQNLPMDVEAVRNSILEQSRFRALRENPGRIEWFETQRPEAIGRQNYIDHAQALMQDATTSPELWGPLLEERLHPASDMRPAGDMWDSVLKPSWDRFSRDYYFPMRFKELPTGVFRRTGLWNKVLGPLTARYHRPRYYGTLEEALQAGKDPVTDAAELWAIRGREMAAALSRSEYWNQIGARFGTAPFEGYEAAGYVTPKGTGMVPAQKALRGQVIRSDIYQEAINYGNALMKDPQLRGFRNLVGTLTGQFKGLFTVWRPAYYTRNALSDGWQMWLAGMRDPTIFADGERVWQYMNRNANELTRAILEKRPASLDVGGTLRKTGITLQDAARGFLEGGGNRGSWAAADVGIRGKKWSLLWPGNSLAKISGGLEGRRRMALYLDGLYKGMDTTTAIRRMHKFMYNFAELSPAEQNVFRHGLLFYSWFRKNIAFQMRSVLEYPEQFVYLQNLRDAMIRTYPESRQQNIMNMPDFMRQMYAIPMPKSVNDAIYERGVKAGIPQAEDTQYYMFPSWAIQDWFQLTQLRGALGLVHPLWQLPLELAENINLFTGQQYKPGDRVPVTEWAMMLPESWRSKLGIVATPWKTEPNGTTFVTVTSPRQLVDQVFNFLSPFKTINDILLRSNPGADYTLVDPNRWLRGVWAWWAPFSARGLSGERMTYSDTKKLSVAIEQLRSHLEKFVQEQGNPQVKQWADFTRSAKNRNSIVQIMQDNPPVPYSDGLWPPAAAYLRKLADTIPLTVFSATVGDVPEGERDLSVDVMPQIDWSVQGRNWEDALRINGWEAMPIGMFGAKGDGGPPRMRLTFVGRRPVGHGAPPPSPQPQPQVQTQQTPPSPQSGGMAATPAWSYVPPVAPAQLGNVAPFAWDVGLHALDFKGIPYRWGGRSRQMGLDCAGLVHEVFGDYGVELPWTTYGQWNYGTEVPVDQLQFGDLIFFWTGGPRPKGEAGPNHVGIYVGRNQFLHSPGIGKNVRLQDLSSYSYRSTARARRLAR